MNKQRFLTTLNIVRLKLFGKALRTFPSSPKQNAIYAQILEVHAIMERLGWEFKR